MMGVAYRGATYSGRGTNSGHMHHEKWFHWKSSIPNLPQAYVIGENKVRSHQRGAIIVCCVCCCVAERAAMQMPCSPSQL